MCGFVGYIGNQEIYSKQLIKNMADRIAHRGPDDESYYIDSSISLGFRRLEIIGLNNGKQPMENEDGSLVLCFNGEIYNYKILKKELILKGHTFKTSTDSEVLLHGYEEYGEEILAKLRGMFAFILWNKNTNELFGARDLFGIKPFYYGLMNETFLFGSEIKSFLPHPAFTKTLNEQALANYLSFGYSVGTETFFKNIFKLAPGHSFTYKNGALSLKKYASANLHPSENKSHEEWVSEIDSVLKNSVKQHKVSDVPLGSFLSSGVDSSYISTVSGVKDTYTIGFKEHGTYNEIPYAAALSKKNSASNNSLLLSSEDYWKNIEDVQYFMDEPLGDAAAIALYSICNSASKKYKIMLSGEGADELFGGYNIYKEPLSINAYNNIPFPIRWSLGKLASILPNHKGRNFFVRRGQSAEKRFIGSGSVFSSKERKSILKNKKGLIAPHKLVESIYRQAKGNDIVSKMQEVDLNTWLSGDILLKADKMSMANSLEVRVPFLDKEVFKVASKLPISEKINLHTTKYAFRSAAKNHMPDEFTEKRKLGFPVPIRIWLKEDRYYNLVKTEFTSDIANTYFNSKKILYLLDAHKTGRADYSKKIWTIYSFLIWYNQFFTNKRTLSLAKKQENSKPTMSSKNSA